MNTRIKNQIQPKLIGMLHVPICTILAAPPSWRNNLDLPEMTSGDWLLASELPKPSDNYFITEFECSEAAIEKVEMLSIYPFLRDRLYEESNLYIKHGIDSMMLENIAGPYFVRNYQPSVIYWIMRSLAKHLKSIYPNIRIGLQILAYSDNWAMDIACRCGLDFIRCESALFEGMRPEGMSPNQGNLAKLYMMRNILLAEIEKDGSYPQVYVDVKKKHTVFMSELKSLNLWLDNIIFQKLEGVIITGKATGCPVEEKDLSQARKAIEKSRVISQIALGKEWAPPLIIGSGVSVGNIAMCRRYADVVIVGSSFKKSDYWENTIDENRVKRFVEVWHE